MKENQEMPQESAQENETDNTDNSGQNPNQNETDTPPSQASAGQNQEVTQYKDFVLPQGIEPDEQALSEFKNVAGKFKLSQETAQALLDVQTKQIQAQRAAQYKQMEQTYKNFESESYKLLGTDKERGEVLLKKAVEFAGGQELRQFFANNPMLGVHPILVKAFLKIGKALSEDNMPSGASAGGMKEKSFADTLYPGMKKENPLL